MLERDAATLRQQAEEQLRAKQSLTSLDIENLTPQAMRRLLHDLQVHQVELEMQNEELRSTQLQLELSRARYFELYDMAPVGYCTVSENGLILEANFNAASLFGLSRSDLVSQPVSRFIDRADQDIYYRCRKQLFESGETQSCELQLAPRGKSALWVRMVISAAQDANGAPIQHLVLGDITDRRSMNHALQTQNTALAGARLAADKANLTKSEFLSSMSHELRSPLHAILGFAQLIESGTPAPTDQQKSSIDQILRAGWYLLGLINEILDLSLVESGQLTLLPESIAVADLLRECHRMMDPAAQTKGIHMLAPVCGADHFTSADPVRLKQVMVNLLSNAIKYNRAGGSVEVRCSELSATRLRISVRDTGNGLPEHKLSHLFEPFNRLGKEAGSEEGTGIGLVMSKRLVELMGGTIGAQSSVGVGSVFWIELIRGAVPHSNPGESSMAPLPATVTQPDSENGSRTLLYVEDNQANMDLVEKIVARRPDLRFLSAGDGLAGVAMAVQHLPDVIVMDIHLPGISGLEALDLLRKSPATRHIPVLALSANAMPRDIENGLEAGFFRYLTKPIRVSAFLQALDLALALPNTRTLSAHDPKDPLP